MNNSTQFGSILKAHGVSFNYDSTTAALEVIEPSAVLVKVLDEISKYDTCNNAVDTAAALVLAEFIDNEKNPLKPKVRENVLHALGLKKDGLWVYQALALQLSNRSWHYSDEPNTCTHFGEECTHRGINQREGGRKSIRQPTEYHLPTYRGKKDEEKRLIVSREQLVTHSLKEIFLAIPKDHFVTGSAYHDLDSNIRQLKKLSLEDRLKVLAELSAA